MKIRPVIIIVPVVLLLFSLVTASALLWQIFVFSLILLLAAWGWARLSLRGLVIRTDEVPDHLTVGDWLHPVTTIDNTGRLPRFGLGLKPASNLKGLKDDLKLNLPSDSYYRWKDRFRSEKRGQYDIGKFAVTASDPFGIFTVTREFGDERSVIIYPLSVDLTKFQPELHYASRNRTGQRLLNETSSDISRVREYSEGDTLNHIHWRSTAHTGALMVKVFEPEPVKPSPGDVWVISNLPEGIIEVKEELTVTLVSSFFDKYVSAGIPAGLILNGDSSHFSNPSYSPDHITKVKETLAMIRADSGKTTGSLIRENMERISVKSTIIVVDPKPDDVLFSVLSALKIRGSMPVLILVEPSGSADEIRRKCGASGIPVYSINSKTDIGRTLDTRRSMRMRSTG